MTGMAGSSASTEQPAGLGMMEHEGKAAASTPTSRLPARSRKEPAPFVPPAPEGRLILGDCRRRLIPISSSLASRHQDSG